MGREPPSGDLNKFSISNSHRSPEIIPYDIAPSARMKKLCNVVQYLYFPLDTPDDCGAALTFSSGLDATSIKKIEDNNGRPRR